MSFTNYTLGAIVASTTTIKDIKRNSMNPSMQKLLIGGSGSVENTFGSILSLAPVFQFDTGDIVGALTSFGGISGALLQSSALVAWYKKLNDGGGISTTGIKLTVVKGLVVPTQFRFVWQQQAIVSYDAHLLSADGTTAPYSIQTGQTLPATSDTADSAYGLSAVNLNGTALDGVAEVIVTFGLQVTKDPESGIIYPTFGGYMKRAIQITIRAKNAEAFASWGIEGQLQSDTDSTIVLGDMSLGGKRGSSPITLTIDHGMMNSDSLSASDGQAAENSIVFDVLHDGTAAPIAISGLS